MTPRTPRTDLRDKREREILEAAAAVFAKRGFQTARVIDVARQAGIGKGTIYEYFKSKDDLFIQLFDWYCRQASTSMLEEIVSSSDSVVETLRRSGESVIKSGQEMLWLYPLTMEFWAASTLPEFRDRLMAEFREFYERFRSAFAELIEKGIDRGELSPTVDPNAVAAVLVSTFDGLFLQAWFDRSFDAVASGRHFLEIVLRGMATRGSEVRSDKEAKT